MNGTLCAGDDNLKLEKVASPGANCNIYYIMA